VSGYLGTDLVGQESIPLGARAALLIVHGMAEHRGRYAGAVERFTANNIAAFTFDLRGHGQSPGERADIRTFQDFVDDLQAIRRAINAAHPDLPLFIWAHSLGSIITIRAVEQDSENLAGVITSGCPLAAFPRMPSPLRNTVRMLTKPFRGVHVSPGLPATDLSHSKVVQDEYVEDPLVPEKVTVRLLVELERACRAALEQAGGITLPWLALHGGADNIAPPQGSRQLVDALGSRDKALHLFAGMRHEVHNEIEPTPTDFYGLVVHWIGERAR
jgi:alpha-beta hydrolase superfamily lysophospholipase